MLKQIFTELSGMNWITEPETDTFKNKESKKIIFNDIAFYKSSNGYYTNSKVGTLHRYIWIYYNGKIPKGCVIHHKDFNKENNNITNLQLMGDIEHRKLHMIGSNNFNFGRKFTKEHIKRLSESHKGQYCSEETRRKLSIASKGRIVTPETRKKISMAQKGKKMSESAKANMRGPRPSQYKKVLCIETNVVYESMSDAVRKTGIKHVGNAAIGNRKTAGGYHWRYI